MKGLLLIIGTAILAEWFETNGHYIEVSCLVWAVLMYCYREGEFLPYE